MPTPHARHRTPQDRTAPGPPAAAQCTHIVKPLGEQVQCVLFWQGILGGEHVHGLERLLLRLSERHHPQKLGRGAPHLPLDARLADAVLLLLRAEQLLAHRVLHAHSLQPEVGELGLVPALHGGPRELGTHHLATAALVVPLHHAEDAPSGLQ
jgi:hypothetical protein